MSAMDPARLRLSDAERDAAARDLGEHYAQGRLTQTEHEERLEAIWSAKTRGELPPVFADLPSSWTGSVSSLRPTITSGFPVRPAPATPQWSGRVPSWLLTLLAIVGIIAVVTHAFPLVLIGLAVWFLFLRGPCGASRHGNRRR